ncbi:MAG: hypothetical protein Q8P93_01245 [bacterium]|nr:hypothetical protein [bacterium]
MNTQTKTCQNCKTDFIIEPEDFDFYKTMQVPAPTFCPQCRMVRRMVWRNERALYSRKDARGVSVVSPFSEESSITVFDRDHWWSDEVDTKDYCVGLDLSKNFFSLFGELLKKAPFPSLFNAQCINSNYCNHASELKDCYLTFASYGSEKLFYSHKCGFCRDSLDISVSDKCERCYEGAVAE